MPKNQSLIDNLIPIMAVPAALGLCKAAMYTLINRDSTFPPRIRLTSAKVYIEREALEAWIISKTVTGEA